MVRHKLFRSTSASSAHCITTNPSRGRIVQYGNNKPEVLRNQDFIGLLFESPYLMTALNLMCTSCLWISHVIKSKKKSIFILSKTSSIVWSLICCCFLFTFASMWHCSKFYEHYKCLTGQKRKIRFPPLVQFYQCLKYFGILDQTVEFSAEQLVIVIKLFIYWCRETFA